jgi:hypothetical protein
LIADLTPPDVQLFVMVPDRAFQLLDPVVQLGGSVIDRDSLSNRSRSIISALTDLPFAFASSVILSRTASSGNRRRNCGDARPGELASVFK